MDLVAEALNHPNRMVSWPPRRWEIFLGQARRSNLVARVASILQERGMWDQMPSQPLRHLQAAQRIAKRQQGEVRWEAQRIRLALDEIGLPLILLKGAAYVAACLPCSRGRLMSDIDILVPREGLVEVEAALLRHGWISDKLDTYDQRYYRTWMHELPPMRHITRQTVLDVHHSIVPLTSRHSVDASKILACSRPIEADPELWSLAPVDIVLHSAAHLILEGEFSNALRDLADIDDLLRHFGRDPSFWPALLGRAAELDLGVPLYFAVKLAAEIFTTPLDDEIRQGMERLAPHRAARIAMLALFRSVAHPEHPSCDSIGADIARWLLYIRGHYLRMPLRLLLPHLARKGWRRRGAER